MDDLVKVILASKLLPQKKEWVGLTEDEATVLFRLCLGKTYDHFWRAIEAKLREKNG